MGTIADAITDLETSMKKYIENAREIDNCASKLGNLSQLSEINKYRREFKGLVDNQDAQLMQMKKRSAQKREARLVDEIVKLADKIRNAQVALNDAIELELQVITDYAIAAGSDEEMFGESKDECINRHKELVVDADYTVKSLKREMRLLAQ